MTFFGHDSLAGEADFDQEKVLQAKLDSINCEHGHTYIEGIQLPLTLPELVAYFSFAFGDFPKKKGH
jgi:hypothetical protein